MNRKLLLTSACFTALCLISYLALASGPVAQAEVAGPAPGALQIIDPGGNVAGICPLKHTDVDAEVSGFLARVTVTQEFENPSASPIEAVYTFPLPSEAAVDRMTMKVGERIVAGKIKRKEEARRIYDAAREAGQVASLLDQERPNIFTQSVANIMPGDKVLITISYVETLSYKDGSYQFVFPMVVGPRYIPGEPTGKQGGGREPDTNQVPDASRITPPVAAPGTRAGHDISLKVRLDAGVPIMEMKSTLHDVDTQRTSDHSAIVELKDKATIPNKDFILTYDVAGGKIEDAVLTHNGERGGFFTMILQPPDRIAAEDVAPREIVYVLDTSGSMQGHPIEKAKETMELTFEAMRPEDTFNLITFSGDTHILFPAPVTATPANVNKARAFLKSRNGSGGTEMMAAIRAALDPTDKQDHVRVVCFMTDGYVGNDMEIIGEIQKHPNARVFSFGIGNSVNRFLLDKMSEEGRGEVEYVTLEEDGSAAARRFAERVQNPLFTDITVEWGDLKVADVYPKRIPDVFSAKPIVVTGRYANAGKGVVRIRGKQAGREVVREVQVDLPGRDPDHDVLASLWARRRIESLMSEDWAGAQRGQQRGDVKEAVTQVGLEYGLMTQYTSFVAVEEMVVNEGGEQRRVEVPVELPDGVSYDGVFGADKAEMARGRATGAGAAGPGGLGYVMPKPARRMDAKSKQPVSPAPSVNIATEEKEADARPLSSEPPPPPYVTKLDSALAAVVERLKTNGSPASSESQFVRDGKAEVQVWLTNTSEETLAKLRALGFEIVLSPKSAKMVIGRISIQKLEALAKLDEVRYAKPNLP